MTWPGALFWIDAMNTFNYLGFSDWRLPNSGVNGDGTVVDCFGGGIAGCKDNELGYLYWDEGIRHATQDPFSNIESSSYYWSGTGATNVPNYAWILNLDTGGQTKDLKNRENFVWAVANGDPFAPVPLLPTLWLFGSGLLGFIGVSRQMTCK